MVGVAQLVEPRVVIPVVVGSSPIVHPTFEGSRLNRETGGPLAQLVEHRTLNPPVRGSNPRGPTTSTLLRRSSNQENLCRVSLWGRRG